jgi:hypothetical protein
MEGQEISHMDVWLEIDFISVCCKRYYGTGIGGRT